MTELTDLDLKDLTDLYRAIGRIEGQNNQILDKQNALIADYIKHQDQDRRDFQDIRTLIDRKLGEHRDESDNANAGRDKVIADLALRIQEMEKQSERAKGAGWVILSLMTASAGAIGTAVWAVVSGHIAWK